MNSTMRQNLPVVFCLMAFALLACSEEPGFMESDAVVKEREAEKLLFYSNDLLADDYLNPEIEYGEITDERDGQVYKTVTLGEYVWMAQNLNYADSVNTPALKGNSWCYDDNPENCKKGGRLYSWYAAVDYDSGYTFYSYGHEGICPEGFHLPGYVEVQELQYGVSGLRPADLSAVSGWYEGEANTDNTGFTALPAGARINQKFVNGNFGAYFWSDYASPTGLASAITFNYSSTWVEFGNKSMANAYSLRCVRALDTATISSSSSSLAESSSSVEPPYSFGSMEDARDGEVYRTLELESGTWLAENLRFKSDSVICEKHGGECDSSTWYYLWADAMRSCPEGWRLPDTTEWRALRRDFGAIGKVMGEDIYDSLGFSGVAHHYAVYPNGYYSGGEGYYDFFWSSTENDTTAVLVKLGKDYLDYYPMSKRLGNTVRCRRDDSSKNTP